jgi:hypothetical protein
MPELRAVYYSQVGHESARFFDTTLEFTDPKTGSIASDSVVLLENGGGKTSLLQLLFSVFEPNLKRFLGRTSQGEERKFDLYFEPGEVGYIVTEWQVAGSDQPRVVGQCVERKKGSDEKVRYFFTFLANDTFNVNHLPIRQNRRLAKEITSAQAFNAYFREQSARDQFITNVERDWVDHLRKRSFEPLLFRLLLQMNQQEASSKEMLSFVGSAEQFVNLVVSTVVDSDRAEPVLTSIKTQKDNLRHEAAYRVEEGFLETLRVPITDIIAPAQAKTGMDAQQRLLRDNIDRCIGKTKGLANKLEDDMQKCLYEAGEAKEQREGADRLLRRRDNELHWLQTASMRQQIGETKAALNEGQAQAEDLSAERAALDAGDILLNIDDYEIKAEGAMKAVVAAEEPHKKVQEDLFLAGDLLVAALSLEEQRLDGEVSKGRHELDEAGKILRAFLEKKEGIILQSGKRDAEVKDLKKWLTEFRLNRQALEEEGIVEKGVAAGTVRDRLRADEVAKNRELAAKQTESEDLTRRANELHENRIALTGKKVRTESSLLQISQILMRFEEEHSRLDEELPGYEEYLDSNLSKRLSERIASLQDERARLTIESQDDRSDVQAIERSGVLPASRDASRTADYLNKHRIDAETSLKSLARIERGKQETIRERMKEDPGRYAGVVVSAQGDMDKAQTLLANLQGLRSPLQVTFLGAPRDPAVEEREKDRFVLPANSATYNRDAAVEWKRIADERVGAIDAQIKGVTQDIEEFGTLRKKVDLFYDRYPGNWEEEKRHEHQTVAAEMRLVVDEMVHIEEEYRVLSRRTGELGGEIKSVMDAIRVLEKSLVRLDGFIGVFESKAETKQHELDEAMEARDTLKLELSSVVRAVSGAEKRRDDAQRTLSKREGDRKNIIDRKNRVKRKGGKEVELPSRYDLEVLQSDYQNLEDVLKEKAGVVEGKQKEFDLFAGFASEARSRFGEFEERIQERAQGIKHGLTAEEGLEAARAFIKERRRNVDKEHDLIIRRVGGLQNQHENVSKELARFEKRHQGMVKPVEASDNTDFQTAIAMWEEKVGNCKSSLESAQSRLNQINVAIAGVKSDQKGLDYILQEIRRTVATCDEIAPDKEPYEEVGVAATQWNALAAEQLRIDEEMRRIEGILRDCRDRIASILSDVRYSVCSSEIRANLHSALDTIHCDPHRYLKDIEERIAPIKHELANMQTKKEIIVQDLYELYRSVVRSLDRIQKDSQVPASSGPWAVWSGKPFIEVRINEKVRKEDAAKTLLRAFVEDLMSEKTTVPDDPVTVLQWATRAVLRNNIEFFLLKPEHRPRLGRHRLEEFRAFSGGEKMTAAILLFMTFANLLSLKRTELLKDGNPLLLDNPLGASSSGNFIELQRAIARSCNIQIIYTTAVNDHQALGQFGLIIKMARRIEDQQGRRYVHVDESVPGETLGYDTAVLRLEARRAE